MAKAKKKMAEEIEESPKAKGKAPAKGKASGKSVAPMKGTAPAKTKAAAPVKANNKKAPAQEQDDTEEVVVSKPAPKPSTKAIKEKNAALIADLDRILEAELSGVVRYLHYSFMIFGPNRIPITKWFREHALEGFQHAVTIGEKITALGGHPSIKVEPVPETNKHNVMEILKESIQFERVTLNYYHEVLSKLEGDVALEEMIRGLVHEETCHIEEVEKMIRGGK